MVAHGAVNVLTTLIGGTSPLTLGPSNVTNHKNESVADVESTREVTVTSSMLDNASSARSTRHAGASCGRHSNTVALLYDSPKLPAVIAPALLLTVTLICCTAYVRVSLTTRMW
jgi:hypothetical protein